MIKIGGLQKMTLIDYPGKIAATVFLAGCNFKCGYCHNPDLVLNNPGQELISEEEFFSFLKKRKGLLDGICISGGEPLCQEEKELLGFLQKIKKLGYLIKLDTNGFNFPLLKKIVGHKGLIDYIAMDVKASLDRYGELTNIKNDFSNIEKSIKLIMTNDIDYEFRTTALPAFHELGGFEKILQMIRGAKNFYIQNFNNRQTLNPRFNTEATYKPTDLEKMKELAQKYVEHCEIRT
jgi:pyruvate formate lyase activating enzyme